MKIIQFGCISENTDGGLSFDGFHTDLDGDEAWRPEVFIECVIERLRKAKAEVTAVNVKTLGPPVP